MGVMECNRKGCSNILCRRCILDSSAYICDECFAELVAMKGTWQREMTAADVRDAIEQFMASRAGTFCILNSEAIDAEFERLVPEPRH